MERKCVNFTVSVKETDTGPLYHQKLYNLQERILAQTVRKFPC